MFTTLLESRAGCTRRAGSTTMSMLLHGGIIAGAVALTMPSSGEATTHAEPPAPVVHYTQIEQARVEAAPSNPVQAVAAPMPPRLPVLSVPINVPVGIPPVDIGPSVITEETVFGTAAHLPSGGVLGGIGVPQPGGVSEVADVERIPRLLGQPPAPRYPGALRQGGMDGHVLVRFVIDTLGRAEMDGLAVQESSHPLFADAVRAALPQYRFSPGEVGGRKVRTMVQLPFTFTLRADGR